MFTRIISAFMAVSLITSCGSVTLGGLVAASRLDPLETIPSENHVAVSVPDTIRLRNGDAVFRIGFTPNDQSITEAVEVIAPLIVMNDIASPRSAASGEAIFVFGFSAAGAADVTAAQEQIKVLKAQEVEGTGTLRITIESGCFVSELGESLDVSTWIRTDPSEDFVLLTRSVNLFEILPPEDRAELESRFTPC